MPEVLVQHGLPTKDIMLYPRKDDKGTYIAGDQMVSYREHLSRKNRMIFLTGPISEDTEACNLLMAMASMSDEPLKMVITSPGGYLESTYMFCDTMKMVMEKTPIYTLGRFVCSAAVLPFVCGTKRFLMPHAKLMLHLLMGQLSGDPKDIDIQRDEMLKTQHQMVEFLQAHGVKKTEKKILEEIDRERWMNPKEAIEYGLADEIMSPDIMKTWLS
jgi:ATP-dependent Clp protease protease subunit